MAAIPKIMLGKKIQSLCQICRQLRMNIETSLVLVLYISQQLVSLFNSPAVWVASDLAQVWWAVWALHVQLHGKVGVAYLFQAGLAVCCCCFVGVTCFAWGNIFVELGGNFDGVQLTDGSGIFLSFVAACVVKIGNAHFTIQLCMQSPSSPPHLSQIRRYLNCSTVEKIYQLLYKMVKFKRHIPWLDELKLLETRTQ